MIDCIITTGTAATPDAGLKPAGTDTSRDKYADIHWPTTAGSCCERDDTEMVIYKITL